MVSYSYGFCPKCSGRIDIPGIETSLCKQCGWVIPVAQPQAKALRVQPAEAVLRITVDLPEEEPPEVVQQPEEPVKVVERFEQMDLWGGLS